MADNGYAPSVREICRGCNIPSTATCFTIINDLADRGLIEKSRVGENKRRAMSVKQHAIKVPLVGTVAAGEPIFAQENYEDFVSIPSNLFGTDDMFMLTVKGDSMINIGMFSGDMIIVKKQETAENGEIVVALVDDSATVKRFYNRAAKFSSLPETSDREHYGLPGVAFSGTWAVIIPKMN